MTKPIIGERVTVTERIEAYYSGYAGRPECWITPGMIGRVAAVNVPSVCRERVTFNCVDFVVNGKTERIAARNTQLKRAR